MRCRRSRYYPHTHVRYVQTCYLNAVVVGVASITNTAVQTEIKHISRRSRSHIHRISLFMLITESNSNQSTWRWQTSQLYILDTKCGIFASHWKRTPVATSEGERFAFLHRAPLASKLERPINIFNEDIQWKFWRVLFTLKFYTQIINAGTPGSTLDSAFVVLSGFDLVLYT